MADKMVAILQMTFSNAFSWEKICMNDVQQSGGSQGNFRSGKRQGKVREFLYNLQIYTGNWELLWYQLFWHLLASEVYATCANKVGIVMTLHFQCNYLNSYYSTAIKLHVPNSLHKFSGFFIRRRLTLWSCQHQIAEIASPNKNVS